MKKRRFIAFAVLAAALLVGISVAIRRGQRTVTYHGQPLQTWTIQAYRNDSNAVATLKELGTNAIPGLLRLLKTHDSFFRRQTWRHLPRLPLQLRRNIARRYPPPQAEAFREAAARALGRLGADATVAIPALSRALRDNQGRVRWEAAIALAAMGKDSITTLIEALDEKDSKTRHAAAYALGEIGPAAVTAVPALVRSLNDQDQAVRNSAAYSLTTIGTPGFLALLDVVEQSSEPARGVATRMLTNAHLAQLKASSEFLRMTHDESPARRQRALEALGVIRVAGSLAIHASLEALDDPVMEVRLAAIRTLGARGGTETNVVQALTDCLKDDSASIRDAAAQALEKLNVQGTN